MGFLKRFLSLGSTKSRKNKKKQNAASTAQVDAEGRMVVERGAQDADTSANRLLRSTSTKFSVMSEIDYTSLPPLPHSVQDLLNIPSLSPSPSLVTVATAPALQRSGTYVVKVHGRTTHSRTEFPRANPPVSPTKPRRKQPKTPKASTSDDQSDQEEGPRAARLKEVNFTPKDTSRLYNLRRDPSVASLLNLYDDKGCLDSAIFGDASPPPAPSATPAEGHEPRKRTGSTLRQLLGGSEPFVNETAEGDISWAEQFLDEQLAEDSPQSSPSSPDLETPKDALFPDNFSAPRVAAVDTTFSSLDPDSSMNYPAISSMEVEVSGSEEGVPVIEVAPVPKPLLPDPKTPQRASEVFGFLSRRNTLTVKERDLPPLPQILTPDNTGDAQNALSTHDHSLGETLDTTPSANTSHSTQHTSSDTNSHASHAQIQTATMTKLSSAFAASTTSLNLLISQEMNPTAGTSKEVLSHETGTASQLSVYPNSHHTGSSLSSSNSTKMPPSKIPRGPRPRPLSISRHEVPDILESHIPSEAVASQPVSKPSSSSNSHSGTKTKRSKREAFTDIPPRQHRRTASRSSAPRDRDDGLPTALTSSTSRQDGPSRKRSTKPHQSSPSSTHGKENTPSPPRLGRASPGPSSIPVLGWPKPTPIRPHVLAEPPSPASSLELSPLAREMMNDLRQQRTRARQVERRRGIWVRE